MTRTLHTTDHQLKVAIADELDWAPRVNADRIGATATDGAVTLSRQVHTDPEKQPALRVRAVSGVADEIAVQHEFGASTDADIAREAAAAFDRSVVIPARAVTATAHDQIITLTGAVDWQYQREEAQRAVATLPGVRNTITVTPEAVVSPAQAKTQIAAALLRNAQLEADRIQVDHRQPGHPVGCRVLLGRTPSSRTHRLVRPRRHPRRQPAEHHRRQQRHRLRPSRCPHPVLIGPSRAHP